MVSRDMAGEFPANWRSMSAMTRWMARRPARRFSPKRLAAFVSMMRRRTTATRVAAFPSLDARAVRCWKKS